MGDIQCLVVKQNTTGRRWNFQNSAISSLGLNCFGGVYVHSHINFCWVNDINYILSLVASLRTFSLQPTKLGTIKPKATCNFAAWSQNRQTLVNNDDGEHYGA